MHRRERSFAQIVFPLGNKAVQAGFEWVEFGDQIGFPMPETFLQPRGFGGIEAKQLQAVGWPGFGQEIEGEIELGVFDMQLKRIFTAERNRHGDRWDRADHHGLGGEPREGGHGPIGARRHISQKCPAVGPCHHQGGVAVG